MALGDTDETAAIRELIGRQFVGLSWTPEQPADWHGVSSDFLPDAKLFPSIRPVVGSTVAEFVDRMQRLATSTLTSLEEEALGVHIVQFGNVAVATAGCRVIENDGATEESAEMFLLVKSDGAWRIAAQAWDKATAANPLPPLLRNEPAVANVL